MWNISGKTLLSLQGGDGSPFAGVMNALIVREALNLGIPISAIKITLRTNLGDGGVDAAVEVPAVAGQNDKTGWFGVPTIWQFKGTEYVSVSDAMLKNEINKNEAKELIKKGFGYRFCICDDPPAPKVEEWEKILNAEVQSINPTAPPAMVLNTSRIAARVNNYPAIYFEHLNSDFVDIQPLSIWASVTKARTQNYVAIPDWNGLIKEIQTHADFRVKRPQAVISILGASGVGKTRLVYESLSVVSGSDSLVLYTSDEKKANYIAASLLNMADKQAIIVADECSLATRVKLDEILAAVGHRIRVIAIDNSAIRGNSSAPNTWLKKVPENVVLTILEANFPTVPDDQRKSYTNLSGGFIRIAADMCRHHDEIVSSQGFGPVNQRLEDYMLSRLTQDQLSVLYAIAMVKRLGSRDDVREEIVSLCQFIGMDPAVIDNMAIQMKDAPGFVEYAGRYLAVTPEPIARIAFGAGYQRWISPDPLTRLRNFPPLLLDSFRKRVLEHGTEEVRREVGEAFRSEVISLKGTDLGDRVKMQRLATLVETDPDSFLPSLRTLIEMATATDLSKNDGAYIDRWGPRRDLVWLCERAARFPEYFNHAEAILWRLAQVETEPNIGNNATAKWKQLYWIRLSGTPISFVDRLKLLEQRASIEIQDAAVIAITTVTEILNSFALRMGVRDIFGGRIAPPEWLPVDEKDYDICIFEITNTLSRLAKLGPQWRTDLVLGVIEDKLGTLIGRGFASNIYAIYKATKLSQEQQSKLRIGLSDIAQLEERGLGQKFAPETKLLLQSWIEELAPIDLVARVITSTTIDAWHYAGKERATENSKWEAELEAISTELIASPLLLSKVSDFLYSDQSRSAGALVMRLGRLDHELIFLPQILEEAINRESSAIIRWYMAGFVEKHSDQSSRLIAAIESLEKMSPKAAYEAIMTLGKSVDSFNRVIRLIDEKKIGPEYLRGFIYVSTHGDISTQQFVTILDHLISPAGKDARLLVDTAIDLLHMRLLQGKKADEFANDQRVQDLIFKAALACTETKNMTYEWGRVVVAMSVLDFAKSASIAVIGLVRNKNLNMEHESIKVLEELITKNPAVVMQSLGKTMLDPKQGVWFYVGNYRRVFSSIPFPIVKAWIDEVGVEGARKVARHLPPPFIDIGGNPIVPDLTYYILMHFEQDERTFKEFCAGVHGFQVYFDQNIANLHEAEAKVATQFLNHSLPRIRQWAQLERDQALRNAANERRLDEEELME